MNKNEILLSFIIPVYKVEAYLNECIESILTQETNQYEIILVDDGSPDKSGMICDEYAKKYDHISVIHKENGGLSSARNAGLPLACGKYIAFLDSDDRIAYGSLKSVLNWAKKNDSDVCFMEAIKFFPDGKTESLGDNIKHEFIWMKPKEEAFRYLSTRPKYPGSACTKLFKRSFLIENNLFFPKDRRISEDLGFCLDCFLATEEFDALNVPYYEYRQNRAGSITSLVSYQSFLGIASFIKDSASKLTLNKKSIDPISALAMNWVAYEYIIMLWQYSKLDKNHKQEAYNFLLDYNWVLNYGIGKKSKMVKMANRCFGISATSKLLNYYMKVR